jgi:hypothetical protein
VRSFPRRAEIKPVEPDPAYTGVGIVTVGFVSSVWREAKKTIAGGESGVVDWPVGLIL